MLTHAATCCLKLQSSLHSIHALTHAHAPCTDMCASNLWRHGWHHLPLWAWPSSLDPTRICDSVRTTCKKKKKKKGKKKALTKLDLWLWPKSQNFQNGPVLLSFSSIFQFWDPFLHSKLRDCVNVRFLEGWLLHKSWPKVKIFKKDLSCSIFRVHSC